MRVHTCNQLQPIGPDTCVDAGTGASVEAFWPPTGWISTTDRYCLSHRLLQSLECLEEIYGPLTSHGCSYWPCFRELTNHFLHNPTKYRFSSVYIHYCAEIVPGFRTIIQLHVHGWILKEELIGQFKTQESKCPQRDVNASGSCKKAAVNK